VRSVSGLTERWSWKAGMADLGYDLCLVRDHSPGGWDDLRPDNLFDVHPSGEEALDHVATVVCEGSVI